MASEQFSIAIKEISYGWVALEFIVGNHVIRISASYTPEDSLLNLIKSGIKALNGYGSKVKFYLEPRLITLIVSLSNNKCTIELDNIHSMISTKQYARAVLRCFDKYLNNQNEKDYIKVWRHEYPKSEINKLRELYHAQT